MGAPPPVANDRSPPTKAPSATLLPVKAPPQHLGVQDGLGQNSSAFLTSPPVKPAPIAKAPPTLSESSVPPMGPPLDPWTVPENRDDQGVPPGALPVKAPPPILLSTGL